MSFDCINFKCEDYDETQDNHCSFYNIIHLCQDKNDYIEQQMELYKKLVRMMAIETAGNGWKDYIEECLEDIIKCSQ